MGSPAKHPRVRGTGAQGAALPKTTLNTVLTRLPVYTRHAGASLRASLTQVQRGAAEDTVKYVAASTQALARPASGVPAPNSRRARVLPTSSHTVPERGSAFPAAHAGNAGPAHQPSAHQQQGRSRPATTHSMRNCAASRAGPKQLQRHTDTQAATQEAKPGVRYPLVELMIRLRRPQAHLPAGASCPFVHTWRVCICKCTGQRHLRSAPAQPRHVNLQRNSHLQHNLKLFQTHCICPTSRSF